MHSNYFGQIVKFVLKYQSFSEMTKQYGGHSETVITGVCGSPSMGSIPIGHPFGKLVIISKIKQKKALLDKAFFV